MTLSPLARSLVVALVFAASGASAAEWPSTSLLAQEGDAAPLPPPDELNEGGDPAAGDPAAGDPADDDPASEGAAGDKPPRGDGTDPSGQEPSKNPLPDDDPAPSDDRIRVRNGKEKPPAFGEEFREKISDLPAPILGALAAGAPVLAVQTGVFVLSMSMLTGGWLVDRFVTLGFVATLIAAAATGLVTLIGATASTFLAGGAILWVLGNDATDTEWDHLLMATMAVVLFFVVAPAFVAAEFMGVPCGSMCCPPGGLNAFAPRISRPIFWMLGAGVAGALTGLAVGGIAGYALTGPGAITPGLAALSVGATVMGAAMGFSLGGAVAAPLGAAVGGSFGIMAPPTGE